MVGWLAAFLILLKSWSLHRIDLLCRSLSSLMAPLESVDTDLSLQELKRAVVAGLKRGVVSLSLIASKNCRVAGSFSSTSNLLGM